MVNFHFFCGIHEKKFESLKDFAKHRKEMGVGPKAIKEICGCCGEYFRTAGELSAHHNVQGFKLRMSTIKNFDKNELTKSSSFCLRRIRHRLLHKLLLAANKKERVGIRSAHFQSLKR